ncbi:MAG: hybrid sensor histidine kinase/response regulator [Ignavibacteria bacterium]
MNKELLIVEDSPTQMEQLRYMLEKNDYVVKVAHNGLAALEMIKKNIPELILSDVMMPQMDGYQLCKTVKETPGWKDIPIMLLTNLSDPHDVIKGLQAGADNFITKPYNETFLLSRIEYILINQEVRKHSAATSMGIEIVFGGQTYFINSHRMQIIDLLLSTYENAVQKNDELSEANKELVEVHRELERKNRELEKLNQERTKFLGIAAHDIRNPISSSLAFCYFLEEETFHKLTNEEKEYVKNIKSANNYVIHLINELLDIAVIQSGKLTLNKKNVDLVSLIKNNCGLNRAIAVQKNIGLHFNPGIQSLEVEIDSVKIEQVLNNLISNAIKFSYPESRIEITLSKDETNGAVISVTDNGQGIPEDELDRLFIPFEKISVRSTAGERSTGLGLSIVKKIVESHLGQIWTKSEVNKGTTISFSLPV